jgi:hypothetical protein
VITRSFSWCHLPARINAGTWRLKYWEGEGVDVDWSVEEVNLLRSCLDWSVTGSPNTVAQVQRDVWRAINS